MNQHANHPIHLMALKETYDTTEILGLPKQNQTYHIGSIKLMDRGGSDFDIENGDQKYTVEKSMLQIMMRDGLITTNISPQVPTRKPESLYPIAALNHISRQARNILETLIKSSGTDHSIQNLRLEREPNNLYDRHAIRLVLKQTNETTKKTYGLLLGYIERERNQEFGHIADLSGLKIELCRNPAGNSFEAAIKPYALYLSVSRKTDFIPLNASSIDTLQVGDTIYIPGQIHEGTVTMIGETLIKGKTFPLISICFTDQTQCTVPLREISGAIFKFKTAHAPTPEEA